MAEKPLTVGIYSQEFNPRLLAANFRIKYRDIFNMKNLYGFMHEWIMYNEWKAIDGKTQEHETFYGTRTDQNKLDELWIWWEIEKPSTAKKYYKYKMKMNFHIVAMSDKEIMHEGKKIKAHSGEVELKLRSWVEINESEMKKHWFLKNMTELFKNRIFESNLDDHKRELYRETYIFQGAIKKFLQMKGFLAEQRLEQFHPPESWP